jgi:UDP-2,3-diacylglucosamine pyrophosphatase LpxH
MYFIGDIHGNFNGLIKILEKLGLKNENLIQVGDFGIGFRSERDDLLFMERINAILLKGNNRLFVIRGNHDDPRFFDGSIKLSNFTLLPDYTVLILEGKTLLLVGGAISIDRTDRRLDLNYWKDEVFILDEEKLNSILSSNQDIDIVVTHSAPLFAYPQGFGVFVNAFSKKDKTLIEDLTRERELLSTFYSIITNQKKPTHWFYGHFHSTQYEIIDGIKFCLLSEEEIRDLNFSLAHSGFTDYF